jgi:hypothetical protein
VDREQPNRVVFVGEHRRFRLVHIELDLARKPAHECGQAPAVSRGNLEQSCDVAEADLTMRK